MGAGYRTGALECRGVCAARDICVVAREGAGAAVGRYDYGIGPSIAIDEVVGTVRAAQTAVAAEYYSKGSRPRGRRGDEVGALRRRESGDQEEEREGDRNEFFYHGMGAEEANASSIAPSKWPSWGLSG